MPDDPEHQYNPSPCQADFTYTMTPVSIQIQDTGKGKKSVAEDLEAVLRKNRVLAPRLDCSLPNQLRERSRNRAHGRMGWADGASAPT